VKLSVIVIAYNMVREIPRTLQALTRSYQLDCADLDYEVLVLDNNSSDRLDERMVASFGDNFHYHFLQDAPPSPAWALNYGARHSSGDILCFMIDGAHLLTPGAFRMALASFGAFRNPLVLTRYFYLGPGSQNESILEGYNQAEEDRLLASIDWPRDGYRLFEIGVPLQGRQPKITWFNKMFETNCMFIARSLFERIGGADERFDIPGGGFLNMDLYNEAASVDGVVPVQLIGEGSFHQLHGGTTTNVSPEERDAKVESYREQYRRIRGRECTVTDKDIYFFGHLPTHHSKIHMWSRPIK
jgi:glycosyltransferase involved in cell wall biosynthesis